MLSPFPPFNTPVPADGYRWWYVDAVSQDGEQALTLIAFVGSVFSPWYAMARRRAATDPLDHCTLNAVLYRRRGKRWAFTERHAAQVSRSEDEFRIGPSRVRRDGETLLFEIDEVTVPVPARLRGTVRVRPEIPGAAPFALDTDGRHHWQPLAPRARVEVNLTAPASRWSGNGYLDSNWGDDALERDFKGWSWSRMDAGRDAAVLYDATRRDGSRRSLALRFARDGGISSFEAPPAVTLPTTGWRVSRTTRSEESGVTRVLRTLEDTPFYARSIVQTRLFGETLTGIHESLSLERFASPWVQCLLPFRAPRR